MYSVEITKTGGFRPLSGSFFLYLKFYDKNKDNLTDKNVSVPYRGLSFYLLQTTSIDTAYNVSVPYRGLFFYIDLTRTQTSASTRFRPLSGSFFLSLNIPMDETTVVGFPSPIGVFIFIYKTYDSKKKLLAEFPSPIGVFLFLYKKSRYCYYCGTVSVPYRGLSFYIYNCRRTLQEFLPVSVPYRGLSFYIDARFRLFDFSF